MKRLMAILAAYLMIASIVLCSGVLVAAEDEETKSLMDDFAPGGYVRGFVDSLRGDNFEFEAPIKLKVEATGAITERYFWQTVGKNYVVEKYEARYRITAIPQGERTRSATVTYVSNEVVTNEADTYTPQVVGGQRFAGENALQNLINSNVAQDQGYTNWKEMFDVNSDYAPLTNLLSGRTWADLSDEEKSIAVRESNNVVNEKAESFVSTVKNDVYATTNKLFSYTAPIPYTVKFMGLDGNVIKQIENEYPLVVLLPGAESLVEDHDGTYVKEITRVPSILNTLGWAERGFVQVEFQGHQAHGDDWVKLSEAKPIHWMESGIRNVADQVYDYVPWLGMIVANPIHDDAPEPDSKRGMFPNIDESIPIIGSWEPFKFAGYIFELIPGGFTPPGAGAIPGFGICSVTFALIGMAAVSKGKGRKLDEE